MAISAPDWLLQHRGDLRPGPDATTWYVLLDGKPQYALLTHPLAGKLACVIRQTINGKQSETPGKHDSADDALRAGLEELRKTLGW